jgi:hypothetical protein
MGEGEYPVGPTTAGVRPAGGADDLQKGTAVAVGSQIEALGKLPRRDDEWEVGFVHLPGGPGGASLCPICVCEGAAGVGTPITLEELLEDPRCADERLLGAVAALALGPTAAPAPVRYLPTVIRTIPGKGPGAGSLREAIERMGVRLEHAKRLDMVDKVGYSMARELMEATFLEDEDDDEPLDIPSLKQVKKLEPARLRSFADAAAAFWQAAPWKLDSSGEVMWQMDPAPPAINLPMCAAIGILGQEIGVGFFFSPQEMLRLAEAAERGRMPKIPRTLWSVTFERSHRLPPLDLMLWDGALLAVAAPEAYPVPAGISPRQTPLRPTPVILTEMELVLRALASLTEADLERGEAGGEFEVFGGKRPLRLVRLEAEEEDEAPLRLVR